jgi:hypothetical protein
VAIGIETQKIMTEKHIDRVKNKIEKYKKALAVDKKYWGGQYHDGGGIRYRIPEQYIKIKDYKGGLRYLNWFEKNFPEDIGYPIFLFECTFILFKCGKVKEAEQKAYQTFFSNTYLFDKFLGKEQLQLDKNESSSWELLSVAESFTYTKNDAEFIEFAKWLQTILSSRSFLDKANQFIEIERQLKSEPVGQKRSGLVEKSSKIKYG